MLFSLYILLGGPLSIGDGILKALGLDSPEVFKFKQESNEFRICKLGFHNSNL